MFKRFSNRDKGIALSLPVDAVLHGIKVKKLPIGQYLKAQNTVKNLPEVLLRTCFGDYFFV